ncbi:MAG: hypothetical protein ACQEQ0_06085 [Bacteroidota bacterium]
MAKNSASPVSLKSKSVSIKSFTSAGKNKHGEAHKSETEHIESNAAASDIDPAWDQSFTPEQLQKAWNNYAHTIEKSNPRLFSMLTAQSPRLKDQNVVVFPLRNETQRVELMKEKAPLFDHLKRELKNAGLKLEIEFIKEENGPQKAYTAADKYKVLAEKNPLLDKLKDVLRLDLE